MNSFPTTKHLFSAKYLREMPKILGCDLGEKEEEKAWLEGFEPT
jgi:hypothetical protein